MTDKKTAAAVFFVILVLSLFFQSCGTGKPEITPYDNAFLNELREKAEGINSSDSPDTESGENESGEYLDFAPSTDTENADAARDIPSGGDVKSMTVYITPTGKCYHFNANCGGKHSAPTTLDSAVSAGYRPCKKCADGG